MKVEDLIKLLQCCDPEAEINFEVGRNDAYRKACARLVLEDDGTNEHDGLGCMKYMCIDSLQQVQWVHSEESELLISLGQDYFTDGLFDGYVVSEAVNK